MVPPAIPRYKLMWWNAEGTLASTAYHTITDALIAYYQAKNRSRATEALVVFLGDDRVYTVVMWAKPQ